MTLDTARAAAWRRVQQTIAADTAHRVGTLWDQVDPEDIRSSWRRLIPAATELIAARSITAASGAQLYVSGTVRDAGRTPNPLATLRASGFADRGDLSRVLEVPALRSLHHINQGASVFDGLTAGRTLVGTIAAQRTRDAARDATAVAMACEKQVTGYVRYLVAPSCGRCAVMAGKFYETNSGFLRHPGCDCQHRPVVAGEPREPVIEHPKQYFDSLSTADQDHYFGKGVADEIRSGKPLSKAVNANSTMWRDTRRRSPQRILAQTGGDRGRSIDGLRGAGYLHGGPRSGGGASGPGGSSGLTVTGGDDWFARSLDGAAKRELAALGEYTAGAHQRINTYLRAKSPKADRWVQSRINRIDAVLRRNPTVSEFQVERLVSARALGLARAEHVSGLAGAVQTQHAYTSTFLPGGGAAFTRSQPVLLTIGVPDGVDAAYIDSISAFRGQREVLIGRGAVLLFGQARYDRVRGMWRIEATMSREMIRRR